MKKKSVLLLLCSILFFILISCSNTKYEKVSSISLINGQDSFDINEITSTHLVYLFDEYQGDDKILLTTKVGSNDLENFTGKDFTFNKKVGYVNINQELEINTEERKIKITYFFSLSDKESNSNDLINNNETLELSKKYGLYISDYSLNQENYVKEETEYIDYPEEAIVTYKIK